MTESYNTLGVLTLVAIDIAKGRHEELVEPPAPAGRRRFRMFDSLEDDDRLADYLRRTGALAVIVHEATGNYHRPLAYFLHREGFEPGDLSTRRPGDQPPQDDTNTGSHWVI